MVHVLTETDPGLFIIYARARSTSEMQSEGPSVQGDAVQCNQCINRVKLGKSIYGSNTLMSFTRNHCHLHFQVIIMNLVQCLQMCPMSQPSQMLKRLSKTNTTRLNRLRHHCSFTPYSRRGYRLSLVYPSTTCLS